MEKVMKSRYATIAIKPKVHDNIKKLAKHSYQTVGGYIEQLVEKEMKQMKWEKENDHNMSRVQG
jgi:mRNA-degrading endonuclease RelE of RelBE toxin-antitoxin system|tara:strand:- start:492 stop:683 length:192 start_codon:yes stop_codon:yes gene_type:complete